MSEDQAQEELRRGGKISMVFMRTILPGGGRQELELFGVSDN